MTSVIQHTCSALPRKWLRTSVLALFYIIRKTHAVLCKKYQHLNISHECSTLVSSVLPGLVLSAVPTYINIYMYVIPIERTIFIFLLLINKSSTRGAVFSLPTAKSHTLPRGPSLNLSSVPSRFLYVCVGVECMRERNDRVSRYDCVWAAMW